MEKRATKALDLLVVATEARRAQRRLAQAGVRHLQEPFEAGSSWRSPESIVMDVLESNEPWGGQALAQARQKIAPAGLNRGGGGRAEPHNGG
jgi:hypothetical protein